MKTDGSSQGRAELDCQRPLRGRTGVWMELGLSALLCGHGLIDCFQELMWRMNRSGLTVTTCLHVVHVMWLLTHLPPHRPHNHQDLGYGNGRQTETMELLTFILVMIDNISKPNFKIM